MSLQFFTGNKRRYPPPTKQPRRLSTVLAIVGIVLGFVGGILWGILALFSYVSWRDGRKQYPYFAWFEGGFSLTIILLGIVSGALSGWGLSQAEAVVFLGVALLSGLVGCFYILPRYEAGPPQRQEPGPIPPMPAPALQGLPPRSDDDLAQPS